MLRALVTALICAAAPVGAGQLTLFAAASTKTALDTVAALWHDESGHDLTVSLAGSSVLARQIQLGAPADLFLSANTAWMDVLEADSLLAEGTRRDLLGNRLVLLAHGKAAPFAISELPARLGDNRLAMALVQAVPAGIYGRAALEASGLWAALAPQVAQTDNVRAALALVEAGETPFAITYGTDAAASGGTSVVYTFPADSHPPITYPIAAIDGGQTQLASEFLDFLRTPEAQAAFAAQGFAVLP